MAQVQVSVTTMEKVDDRRNENKFYRVYVIDSQHLAICQNGSQRNGRTGGTFRGWTRAEGLAKINEKQREGYVGVPHETLSFPVDWDKVKGGNDKQTGERLQNVFLAAAQQGTRTPQPQGATKPAAPRRARGIPSSNRPAPAPPTPVHVHTDRIGELTDLLLDAINTAATDPTAALTAYAKAGEAVDELVADVARVKSYKETLDMLVEDAL